MKRLQQTRYVLGSAGLVTLVVADDFGADDLFAEMWRRIAEFEQRFSRFLPDSELTEFNHAAGEITKISQAFRDLLTAAKTMSERTDGLYNPFVLPALQRAGYEGSWPQPERSDARTSYKNREVVDAASLTITDDAAGIPAATAIDFGGIGKGYLLDELSEFLDTQQLAGYWLSLGGDILCRGNDIDGEPWQIGVQHALVADKIVTHVRNDDGRKLAVATSAITKRKGLNNGKPWHHLIDPRTGESAETDILSATVCANSATDADVYAKCLVLLGLSRAKKFADQKELPRAILQVGEPNHGGRNADTIQIIGANHG